MPLALRDSVQVVAVVQMWAVQVSDPGYKPRERAFPGGPRPLVCKIRMATAPRSQGQCRGSRRHCLESA